MSVLLLKIIACISMVFDHLRYAIPEINNYFFLKNIGRLSYPLFAFCIVEGYIHTKNLKKYIVRLSIFGLISQYPFILFRTLVNEEKLLNIMFTFILGIMAIYCFDKSKNKKIGILLAGLIIVLGGIIHVDYGWFGVATCFVLYLFRDRKLLRTLVFSSLAVLYYVIRVIIAINESTTIGLDKFFPSFVKNVPSLIFVLLSSCFMWLYNGEAGKKNKFLKYFFYIFYPTQCLIVFLISRI